MRKIYYILSILLLLMLGCDSDALLNPSENISGIPVLEIFIEKDDFADLLSNKMTEYEAACRIICDSESHVGKIEASGAGSRYFDRLSFKVKLDNPQTIFGLSEFNLSTQIFDATMVKSVVAQTLYSQIGLPVSVCRNVFVKINNEDVGLYALIERVNEEFFAKRNLEVNELFKLSFGTQFSFNDEFIPQYIFEKKIPDDNNFASLIEFIHEVDEGDPSSIESDLGHYLDIENYIKYHALTTLINNNDAFTNNYFIYNENVGDPYKVIPWDFDKLFHEDIDSGLAGDNQIIRKLFQNETTFMMYKSEVRDQLENVFKPGNIFPVIDSTSALIEYAYNIDPYLGNGRFNMAQEIDKIKLYIENRIRFFENNIDDLSQDYFPIHSDD